MSQPARPRLVLTKLVFTTEVCGFLWLCHVPSLTPANSLSKDIEDATDGQFSEGDLRSVVHRITVIFRLQESHAGVMLNGVRPPPFGLATVVQRCEAVMAGAP